MAGGDAAYDGSLGRNAVGFFGLNVISAGKIDGRGPGETEMVQADLVRGLYRKLILRDDRVVGMILVGDVAAAGVIVSLIRRGADASALAQAFFRRSFSFGDVAAAGIVETADFPDLAVLGTLPRAAI
ncbi:MAG: hypothetical protein NTV79_01220 [Candidatus Aureabacteria bacterium]|nr:hypothetical protein [Candidatus Auribacterota bacterium]